MHICTSKRNIWRQEELNLLRMVKKNCLFLYCINIRGPKVLFVGFCVNTSQIFCLSAHLHTLTWDYVMLEWQRDKYFELCSLVSLSVLSMWQLSKLWIFPVHISIIAWWFITLQMKTLKLVLRKNRTLGVFCFCQVYCNHVMKHTRTAMGFHSHFVVVGGSRHSLT